MLRDVGARIRGCFFFQAEDGIRDLTVTGVQTCALPICGVHQIVTLGYYNTSGINNAQLGIWSWDGSTFTKNSLYNWTTTGTGATGSQGFEIGRASCRERV